MPSNRRQPLPWLLGAAASAGAVRLLGVAPESPPVSAGLVAAPPKFRQPPVFAVSLPETDLGAVPCPVRGVVTAAGAVAASVRRAVAGWLNVLRLTCSIALCC